MSTYQGILRRARNATIDKIFEKIFGRASEIDKDVFMQFAT